MRERCAANRLAAKEKNGVAKKHWILSIYLSILHGTDNIHYKTTATLVTLTSPVSVHALPAMLSAIQVDGSLGFQSP